MKGHDYTQSKAYFVTICAQRQNQIFGEIVEGQMRLNEYGKIAREEWLKTAAIRPNVILGDFVIMPDHFHAIIHIEGFVGATRRVARTQAKPIGLQSESLGSIIGQFKSMVTGRIRKLSSMPNRIIWQRNYYDRIIRSNAFDDIRQYIQNNPSEKHLTV